MRIKLNFATRFLMMTYLPFLIFMTFIASLSMALISHVLRGLVILYHKPKNSGEKSPPVSILISARNEAHNLKNLIPVLMSQAYYDFEVVIALDRCHDESLDLCKALEKKYDNLKVLIIDELPEQFSPKKYALTLAAKAAKNEWLLLTDADCLPRSSEWIDNFSKKMSGKTDFVIGYSPYYSTKGFLNGFILYETFLTAYDYLSSAIMKNPYMAVGRNLAYRRSVFIKANGFNRFQGVMGGDDDLFVQYHADPARVALVFGEDSLTYSDPKETFSAYWRQKKRHFSVSRHYKFFSKARLGLKAFFHVLLWLCFIILAIQGYQIIWVLGLFAGYLLLKSLMNSAVGKMLGAGYQYSLTPLFEGFYVIFLPVIGLVSKFTKKVKWS